MEEHLYKKFYEVETSHWWFSVRKLIVADMVHSIASMPPGSKVLDVGCGTGAMLMMFSKEFDAYGTDTSPIAIEYCRKRGLTNAFCCTLESFPHPEMRFELLTMLDVLEHIKDEGAVLRAAHQKLIPGGRILLTVPAYKYLWSIHDDLNHHQRRYVKSQLVDVLQANGFAVDFVSYFNTILFPSAFVGRIAKKLIKPTHDTTLNIPVSPINSLLRTIFSFERLLLRKTSLPFGLSLIAVARRRD